MYIIGLSFIFELIEIFNGDCLFKVSKIQHSDFQIVPLVTNARTLYVINTIMSQTQQSLNSNS